MNTKMLLSTVIIASFVAIGCGGDSNPAAPTGPTQDPPPGFAMAAVKVQVPIAFSFSPDPTRT